MQSAGGRVHRPPREGQIPVPAVPQPQPSRTLWLPEEQSARRALWQPSWAVGSRPAVDGKTEQDLVGLLGTDCRQPLSLLFAGRQLADLAAGQAGLAGRVGGGAGPALCPRPGIQLGCVGAIHAHSLGKDPVLCAPPSLLLQNLTFKRRGPECADWGSQSTPTLHHSCLDPGPPPPPVPSDLPQGLIQGAGGWAFEPTDQSQAQPTLTCPFSCESGSTLR